MNFSAHEVIKRVNGLNSVSTLNKWAKFVQKNCCHEFPTLDIPFESYQNHQREIRHKQARGYTLDDVQKFQQVAYLIKDVGREEALRRVFDPNYQLEQLNHHDLMIKIVQKVEEKQMNMRQGIDQLKEENDKLSLKVHELERKVSRLNEVLSNQTSGWFRNKRKEPK